METARVVAVVLAAGASSRLGRPKALLEFGGRPVLAHLLDALRAAGVEAGVLVTGEAHDELSVSVPAAPFAWLRNPAPQAGRVGSLQIGLRATEPGADVLMWPVDRPLASADTVRALLTARADAPDNATIAPESKGRRGHPVLFRHELRNALLSAPPDANLREVLKAAGAARVVVPVPDEGIHFDLDTEDAYERALAWWSSRHSAPE